MRPEPRRWRASWIWPRDLREPNGHVLFRRDIQLARVPRSVDLHLAAESTARVWINGREVMRYASLSYPGQHYYETVRVTRALHKGRNRISILVSYIGIPSGASGPKDPGLLAELEGSGDWRSGTDGDWRCLVLDAWQGRQRRSEWFNLDLVEIRDDRRLPTGWPTPAISKDFVIPEALPWPGVRMQVVEPRPFPLCVDRTHDQLTPLIAGVVRDLSDRHAIPALAMSDEVIDARSFSFTPKRFFVEPQPAGKAFSLLLDLGSYQSGRPLLTVAGCPGAVVDVSWHERLEEGRFDVRRTKVYAADRFITGDRPCAIEAEEWKAGRYLQVTFRRVTKRLTVRDLHWRREDYPAIDRATFASSDPRLERIVALAQRAVRLCLHDNIMDCPWREKRQWIGDVQRIGLAIHHSLDDRGLLAATLRQHVRLQDPNGRMWVCQPLFEEFPFQSMEWLRAVLEAEDLGGDHGLRRELAPAALNLHRWFLRHRDRGLFLITDRPVLNWTDNPCHGRLREWHLRTPLAAMNLRYLLFLDDIAELCQREGLASQALAARRERKVLARRIVAVFLDGRSGLLRECADPKAPPLYTELTHALAVCAGLDRTGRHLDAYLHRAADDAPDCVPCSPFGAYVTHQALARLGRSDAIVADILRRWGPMADAGSDTAWEHFPGSTGQLGGGSLCHGWSGHLVATLLGGILGLDARRGGKARRRNLAGVEWIEGSIRPGQAP